MSFYSNNAIENIVNVHKQWVKKRGKHRRKFKIRYVIVCKFITILIIIVILDPFNVKVTAHRSIIQ